MREPHDRRAVVVQREHALTLSRDDALDDRPAVALASGERTLLEDGGVLHVLRAVLGEKPAAIPEVARAGLHDTGVPHRRRGRVTLGERRRVVGGGNPHIARLGQLQRTRLVEGSQQHVSGAAAHRHAQRLPCVPLGVAQQAGTLSQGEHDLYPTRPSPFAQRRERGDGLSRLMEPGVAVA